MYYFIEGVSGAGKSTFVQRTFQNTDAVIISGDILKPCPFIDEFRRNYISLNSYKEQHIHNLNSLNCYHTENLVIVGGLLHAVEYDLIGFYGYDTHQLIEYTEEIIRIIPKESTIIYLETTKTELATSAVINERHFTRPAWISGMIDYLENSPFCIAKGWKGELGIIELTQMIHYCDKAVLQAIEKADVNIQIITRNL